MGGAQQTSHYFSIGTRPSTEGRERGIEKIKEGTTSKGTEASQGQETTSHQTSPKSGQSSPSQENSRQRKHRIWRLCTERRERERSRWTWSISQEAKHLQ